MLQTAHNMMDMLMSMPSPDGGDLSRVWLGAATC
jgi:hypothetical protein